MNTLFLICPTDFLETTINKSFKGKNYFYTSLGNSIQLNDKVTVGQIKEFISTKKITRIIFILKENNSILHQMNKGSNVMSIQHLEKEIIKSKSEIRKYQDTSIQKKLCISNFLNRKVISLEVELKRDFPNITINAMLYYEFQQKFNPVTPSLISVANFTLN